MFTRMTALAALACFALSGAAMAQETATQEETPNTVPTSEGDLSLGEDTSVPQVGQTYVREVVQDWEIQCVKTETGEDEPCQMYQLLQNEAGNPLAEVSLFKLPQGGQAVAGATVIVPLETALQAQLRIAVDGAQSKRYPYSLCNQIGCFARIGLTNSDLNGFKRGAKAVVTIVPFVAQDQQIQLEMSLNGFTASFDKTTVARQ
ncbi:invasion protein IalB [Planktotalea frisia]|uniref:Invasion associated locus B (IalB) protein n=1 Tax=Planktotalea frisia TaxID=696762 RepID=A0A1L9P2B0_9RHOB|nr:invasion associated locus B family protein [Planktotalea frisia]OJI95679.1 invasion associated locus B (IalB) protein [Planktotalea frisia]PZX20918.1 invasion protein IalB [Planktotalea frisia]